MNEVSNEDTVQALWDRVWHCRIRQIDLLSENYIREFGMPTVLDPGIDQEMANQLVDVYIPVVKMIDYYSKGVTVRIVNPEDIKLIYHHLQTHLELWQHRLKTSFNISDAPIEDLMAMNEFANTLYPWVKEYYKNNGSGSELIREIRKLGFVGFGVLPAEKPTEAPQRQDLSDVFSSVSNSLNAY